LDLRRQLAANADKADYRAYRWQQLLRFDYSPEDSKRFLQAIEEVVVPAAQRIYEKRRQQLGLETLRPWDLDVDLLGRLPLRPFNNVAELEEKVSAVFHHVDPDLGGYFDLMRRQNLLDIENRKGKAPGAFCTIYAIPHLPFIFENAVGAR
jgi:oligoendopeptidase F